MRNWIFGISALCIVLGAGYYFMHAPPPQPIPQQPQGEAPVFQSPVVDGMRTYKNALLGFEVTYPEELSVKEYGLRDTSTIVFEDKKGEKAFQVFVVPYAKTSIDDVRFRMDEPSGVFKEPTQVLIDGVDATAFFGNGGAFGDTREVWFIKNGFLYEVTTYKDLDTWLANIMHTWHFI